MRIISATLIAFALSSAADCKCVVETVQISGVVEHRNGEPAAGAVVAVSWARNGLPMGPAIAFSGDDGTFRISFEFATFSSHSFLRGDVCDSRLSQVSVSALAPGYRSEFKLVPVRDWNADLKLFLDPSDP